MTKTSFVTDFSLEEADGRPVTFSALVRAVEQHCKSLLDGETFCDKSSWDPEDNNARLPERWRILIAFAMRGDSEGYYVHIGVMIDFGSIQQPGTYIDIGFAKVWTAQAAEDIAIEAQRFLSAAREN